MTVSLCFKTLFTIHNETMNIYSHLLPGLYFLAQLPLIATRSHVYSVFDSTQSLVLMAIQASVIVFCMLASSIYHLFTPLSEEVYYSLLKLDLIGIGLMIFGLTLCAVFIGFHNFKSERNYVLIGMACLMVGNLIMQMTPCYTHDRFNGCRTAFYVLVLMVCLTLALVSRFYIATPIEIEGHYGQLMLSFVWLRIGFVFFHWRIPERCLHHTKNIRDKAQRARARKFKQRVELFGASHFWWHVFVVLNGYTLYWLSYEFNKHVE